MSKTAFLINMNSQKKDHLYSSALKNTCFQRNEIQMNKCDHTGKQIKYNWLQWTVKALEELEA